MGIKISKVFIKNYKSIEKLELELNDLNLFFGKNNAGKSTILKAINLGINYGSIDKEEVRTTKTDPYSKDKDVLIDLLFVPDDSDSFDDNWAIELGEGISHFVNEPDKDYFAFRTKLSLDDRRQIFKNEKKIIKEWKKDGNSVVSSKPVPSYLLGEVIQCFYIDANRDISVDLRDRKSFWNRMINKVSIDASIKEKIDKNIADANDSIKSNNDSISKIETELRESSSSEFEGVEISPLTKDIETLYKGIDIYYSTESSSNIPVEYLGSGTRSLAAFLTFKAQLSMQYEQISAIYTIFLVEEPEAHVHPQEQLRISSIIKSTKGQRIVATHSPFIVNAFDLSNMFNVFYRDGITQVKKFPSDIKKQELHKIELECLKYKSEMIFSDKIIFVEGQTELLALPIFFRHYLGYYPQDKNISIIDVNGCTNYEPFLHVCSSLNLKWVILSDGEENTIKILGNAIKKAENIKCKVYNAELDERVVFLSNYKYYEDYLVDEGFEDDIVSAINSFEGVSNYFDSEYLSSKASPWNQYKVQKSLSFSTIAEEKTNAVKYYLKNHKTEIAKEIALEICNKHDKNGLPNAIIKILQKI